MGNVAGLFAILAGALLVVIGLRGTQHAAFPGLFPGGVSASSSSGATSGDKTQTPPTNPLLPEFPTFPQLPFLSASGVTA